MSKEKPNFKMECAIKAKGNEVKEDEKEKRRREKQRLKELRETDYKFFNFLV